ncbi:MFS transporter [Plantactinospora sp. KBS50]|uniref:MFS transporter n=1 Tax=Plantactinospora sp. KBS50 TaxID=2024580 RepID=UPI0012FE2359|nr:MFS transporter [Plantactinospora sp. KBS50]
MDVEMASHRWRHFIMESPEATVSVAAGPGTSRRRHSPILAAFATSAIGDGLRLAALPLLAVTITTNPVAIAGLAVAGRLPWLLVALLSGVAADRYNRMNLMILVDIMRGLVVCGLVVFIVTDATSIVTLYVVALALGVGETIFESATQGLLPEVIDGNRLPAANGQLYMANLFGTTFAGPPLGSWLFGIGRAIPFLTDAATFLLSAALLGAYRLKHGYNRRVQEQPADRGSVLVEVGEGFRWIRRHPLIRTFLAVSTVANFTQSLVQSLLVLLATRHLGLSESAFGLLLTASGVGAFLGGSLSAWVGIRLGVHRVLLPAVALCLPLFLVMAWTDNSVVLGAALAVNAFLGVLVGVQMSALRQRIVPNQVLGRVSSVSQFFSFGVAIPVGAFLAGLIADWFGIAAVYLFAAAVIVVLLAAVTNQLMPGRVRHAVEALQGA